MALAPVAASAQYVLTVEQVGANVVATGSGTIDTTDLSDVNSHNLYGSVFSYGSAESLIFTGSTMGGGDYNGLTGANVFTTDLGNLFYATASSGDGVGIATPGRYGTILLLPDGYVSGALLSSASTWDDATIASIGLLDGTYVWTWGSGADAGSFTLDVGAQVPEPASVAVFALGLAGLAAMRRRAAGARAD